MWCKHCNLETNEEKCPVCGAETSDDLPVEIYWCNHCNIPLIHTTTAADKGVCPICGSSTRYLTTDLRPVFPEERLLLALLLGKEPAAFMNQSIWAVNSRYYIDGKAITISVKAFEEADTDAISEQLTSAKSSVDYGPFEQNIRLFITANQHRLAYLKDEAYSFVRNAAAKYKEEDLIISFSGGKDSTVTADVVTKALSNPSLVHIFGNTTLEFPTTIEYANRYRETHPLAIFQIAKNDEQVFYDVCEDIGPPARMMRWCCSMFKTGPITRVINSMYRSQQILTFYGIAAASEKIEALREAVLPYRNDNYILVYCGAASLQPEGEYGAVDDESELRQIDIVTDMLGNELNMKVSQFTSKEDMDERAILKQEFAKGENLQALIAIKCLDEGVNIPQIRTAFILASTTNPKEYIQRRGRVLRLADGKEYAEIYDFITLPRPLSQVYSLPTEYTQYDHSLVLRELTRMEEFARIADNPLDSHDLIFKIRDAYHIQYEPDDQELIM